MDQSEPYFTDAVLILPSALLIEHLEACGILGCDIGRLHTDEVRVGFERVVVV